MAITRLTDIITVFDSKWTYGDVKFGYDGEVNLLCCIQKYIFI